MSKIKCKCGQEYDNFRFICPACGISKYADEEKENVEVVKTKVEIKTDGEIKIEAPEVEIKAKKATKAKKTTK